MALTERQQRFVEEYLADPHLNATQAYVRAGYKARGNAAESAAARLLRDVQVKAALKAARTERAARTALTADWVVERLRVEAERVGELSSHSARVQALHLLGKHQGMFREELPPPPPPPAVSVNVNVGVPVDPSKLNDDQLRQLKGLLDAAAGDGPAGVPAGR